MLEVFQVSPGSNTSERYLLPLLFRNKISKDASTTKLGVGDVSSANEHCKTFIERFITVANEFSTIPTEGDDFVLLFSLNVRKIAMSY